jgi:hypothetical protein
MYNDKTHSFAMARSRISTSRSVVDTRDIDGTTSIVHTLNEPLYDSRSATKYCMLSTARIKS